jgi:hypothetical protein
MSLDLTSDVSTPTADRHRPLLRRLGAPHVYVAPTPAVNPYADSKAASRQRTALALSPLRNLGWSVTNDVGDERHRIEHLVIGTAGTFAIESHTVVGSVRIVGDQVTRTVPGSASHPVPSDTWAFDARLRAAEANKLFSAQLSQRVLVSAVVVIWGDFAQRLVEGHNVTYVHGDDVAAWLKSRPARCGAGRIAELSVALRAADLRAS